MGHDRYRIQYRGIQSRSPPISQAAQVLEGQPRCTSRHSDLISHPHANSNTFQESFGVSSIYHTIQILEFFWRNMHLQHLKFPIMCFVFFGKDMYCRTLLLTWKAWNCFFFLAKKENTCCSHSMTWSLNFNLPRELQPLSINPPCYLVERKTCLALEFETEIFLAEFLGNNGQENNAEKSKSGKISNVMRNENELLPSRWIMLMSVLMRTIMSIIRIAHLSSSSIRKSVEVLVEVWHRRAFVSPHWWCITTTAAKRPKALQCHAQFDTQCNLENIVHCWAVHFNQA